MAEGAGAWVRQRGQKWIVCVRPEPGGRRSYRSCATEEEARRIKDDALASIERRRQEGRTVMTAIDAYAEELHRRGNKPSSTVETPRRLRSFFETELDLSLGSLTELRCQKLYEDLTRRKVTRWKGSGKQRKLVETDKLLSVDTCRNMLAEARSFLRWCVGRGWMRANPLDKVKGIGKRRHGKPQLRVDEARRFVEAALTLALKERGAVAALSALLLGMRASEITRRVVRDLDDGGRLLWIPDSKTEAGRRTLEVPEVLRAHLLRLADGREPTALLFGGWIDDDGFERPHWRDWISEWTRKICDAAKIPRIPAHGLRGTATTIATEAGAAGHLIAAQLGHGSETVAETSYAAPGAKQAAKRKRGLEVLQGGRSCDRSGK